MTKDDDSFNFGAWFKSATQYSMMLFVIFVMFYILVVGTKNKININFSKKENRRILMGMVLVIAYVYRDTMESWFGEIRKDAVSPGSGYFGKLYTSLKTNVLSLNDGYLGDQISGLDVSTSPEAVDSYQVSETLKNQLILNGAVGYVVMKDGTVYSIKSDYFKATFFLESKIERNTMIKKTIQIDPSDLEYGDIFSKIQYKEFFDKATDTESIFLTPAEEIPELDAETEEGICNKCGIRTMSEVEADKYSTVASVDAGELPKCFETDTVDINGKPIYSCCIVEDSGTKFTCPDKCFEFPDGFEEQKFTANEYVDIIKTNEFCSDIELTTQPGSMAEVIRV